MSGFSIKQNGGGSNERISDKAIKSFKTLQETARFA